MSKNLDQDPSGEFGDERSLPMSKERQEKALARMKKACKTEDLDEIYKFFEELYGYRPVPPMPESIQKEVLDVYQWTYETSDPEKLRALFEEEYGFKPTV